MHILLSLLIGDDNIVSVIWRNPIFIDSTFAMGILILCICTMFAFLRLISYILEYKYPGFLSLEGSPINNGMLVQIRMGEDPVAKRHFYNFNGTITRTLKQKLQKPKYSTIPPEKGGLVNALTELEKFYSAYIQYINGNKTFSTPNSQNNIINGSNRDIFGLSNNNSNDINPEIYNSIDDLPNSKDIIEKTVKNLGVGPCGPRAFLGTFVNHIELESYFSELFEMEKAACFSSHKQMIESIPKSCVQNKYDWLIYDEYCRISFIEGLKLVNCNKVAFKHNNMSDLLMKIISATKSTIKRVASRVNIFIYVEGLYLQDGSICSILPQLIENFKSTPKIKLILDETLSFGIYGPRLMGVMDFYGLEYINNIWLLLIGFDSCIGSNGGISIGYKFDIDYQHLNAPGFTYSASLPPYMCSVSHEHARFIVNNAEKLNSNMNNLFLNKTYLYNLLNYRGYFSPFIHLYLKRLPHNLDLYFKSPNKKSLLLSPKSKISKNNKVKSKCLFTTDISKSLNIRNLCTLYIRNADKDQDNMQNVDLLIENMRLVVCNKLLALEKDIISKFGIRFPLVNITQENIPPSLRCYVTINNVNIISDIISYILHQERLENK